MCHRTKNASVGGRRSVCGTNSRLLGNHPELCAFTSRFADVTLYLAITLPATNYPIRRCEGQLVLQLQTPERYAFPTR
jgi:hypothetical protein